MKNLSLQIAQVKKEIYPLVQCSSLGSNCRVSTEMYGRDPDVDERLTI